MAVVGIDLGTTNTVIAAVREGRAAALKDKLGRALLPSVVSFSPSGKSKVGYEAKDRRTIDPENTVFSIKRLIGRTFDSEPVQKARTRFPFELKEGPGKSTLVSCYGADYTLPEISAMVLSLAQQVGTARLGGDVSDAVITVPANFNDLQRAATKVAGRTAGLEVLRIINEPTAAALAYGFGKNTRERIAVYDFGGGTFDVTLLDLSDNVFEVLATAGDTFLGGDDIDAAIMGRMAEELLSKHKVDADADNLVREQLRAAAERLKIDLSTRSMAKAKIEELNFEFTLRRSEFEKLMEPLLAQTLTVCQEAMEIAGFSNKDLDQILLVGGSTRIPLVRRRISSFFGKMPQSRINPDEVVAIGAAIQAASLEAKQDVGPSIPAAPRPRAARSQHPSRAPAPLGPSGLLRSTGTTQTGLAGLKRTDGTSEAPPHGKKSSLAGIKSVPPQQPGGRTVGTPGVKTGPATTLMGVAPGPSEHPSSPPVAALSEPRGKYKTLVGVGGEEPARGKLPTLSGVGEEKKKANALAGLSERPKGTTNLGLGASPSSPPPITGPSPPSILEPQPTFDDVTSVNEGAALVAAELDARARREKDSELTFGREKIPTIPGAAAPPGDSSFAYDQDETTDGSVTFDLAELEALEDGGGFDDLDNEATQVIDSEKVAARAVQLDSQVENDLPSPAADEPEEIGGSALIALSADDLDEPEELDLPAPVSRPPPQEIGDSGLFELDADGEEIDLPSPAAGLPMNRTEVGLPVRAQPHALGDLPDISHNEVGLPLVGKAGLPALTAQRTGTSVPAATAVPAGTGPARTASAEHRLGLGKTQVAPAGIDFTNVPNRSSPPSVHEIDELSVAALLPDDEDEVGEELDLKAAGLESLGDRWSEDTRPLGSQHAELPAASSPLGATAAGGRIQPPSPPTSSNIEDSVASALSQQPPAASRQPAPPAPAPAQQAPRGPLLIDVTPLSLGVEVIGGYVDRLIERNSPIPCEMTRTFATARDNQPMVRVRVSQGEEERFDRNTLLGEVELTGLSQGPRGRVKVDVSFSLDESGILQVSARDVATGKAAGARLMLVGVARE